MSAHSYGRGRVQASEDDAYIVPRVTNPLRPLIVWCHYSAGTALNTITGGPGTLLHALAERGYCVVGSDMGASPRKNWGNSEAQTRIASKITWGQANLPSLAGKVHLIGSSMGSVATLRYAANNLSNTYSVVNILPVNHMQQVRDDDATLRADIDTAWGVTYPTALPVGADPWSLTSTLSGLKYQQWFASDDASWAGGAKASQFATSIGAVSPICLGATGHTDAAVGSASPSVIYEFLRAAE